MLYKNQRKSLQAFANELVNELKAKVPVKSGALKNSIKADVDDDGVTISMLGYGSFVDLGVNGTERSFGSPFSFGKHMPPTSAFEGSAAPFAVSRSIFENGIKPSFFITNNINDEIQEFASDFANAIWNDFADIINKEQQ